MPPKPKKRITPTLIGPVPSTTKKVKKQLLPGKKRLKQRAKSKAKPKAKKKKVGTREELALNILMRVCQKLSGGSKVHKKKAKSKAKSKGGGTKGQKTAAKKLRKLSKHYGKLKYDANPKLAF